MSFFGDEKSAELYPRTFWSFAVVRRFMHENNRRVSGVFFRLLQPLMFESKSNSRFASRQLPIHGVKRPRAFVPVLDRVNHYYVIIGNNDST